VPLRRKLESYLNNALSQISGKSTLAKAIRYALSRWTALTRYTTDCRLEMTNNAVERATGGARAAAMYTLIETCLCRGRHKQIYAACRTMPSIVVFPSIYRDLYIGDSA
jgi:transposase